MDYMNSLIVVIIIRLELDLDRQVSASSNSLFESLPSEIVFVHLVYNSALYLPSCCCSFLLHVLANLNCIFLASPQLVLLRTFQNLLISFVVKKVYPAVLLKNFISIGANYFLCLSPLPLRVQISLPYKRMGTASALCTSILENVFAKVSLKLLFKIPSI